MNSVNRNVRVERSNQTPPRRGLGMVWEVLTFAYYSRASFIRDSAFHRFQLRIIVKDNCGFMTILNTSGMANGISNSILGVGNGKIVSEDPLYISTTNILSMNKLNARVLVVITLTIVLGTIGMTPQPQANADFGTTTVLMNITNTKTNTVKTLEWGADRYQFEENFAVNVDDLKEKKIKQIFGTNEFVFTWQFHEYQTEWYHFKVNIATQVQPTNPMKVTFMQLNYNGHFTNEPQGNENAAKVDSIKTLLNTDKSVYGEGERALLFIGFVNDDDKFVDPDDIFVSMNVTPVNNLLERKKVGSYVYVTPPLEEGENQIIVVGQKEGYNIGTQSVGIAVLPTHSAGDM